MNEEEDSIVRISPYVWQPPVIPIYRVVQSKGNGVCLPVPRTLQRKWHLDVGDFVVYYIESIIRNENPAQRWK